MKRNPNLLLVLILVLLSQNYLTSQWIDAYIADFKVNDDNLNSYQTLSQIGVDSAGNFVVVWRDVRNNPGNTSPAQNYCQRYNKDGLTLGSNFRIGHDSARGPKIAVLKDGRFIVSWIRNFRIGGLLKFEFYFQRFDRTGQALNAPVKVVDSVYDNANDGITGHSIACDTSGRFIITWDKGKIGDTSRIYFQRYDSSGNRIGLPQSVNEANSIVEIPAIAMNNDGSFVIVWQDNRNNIFYNKFDVYMQGYYANGVKIGNNIKVNDDLDSMTIQFVGGISTDKNGYTVVTWSDERLAPITGIYYQLFDSNYKSIGPNRRADINSVWFETGQSKVSMREDKKFIIGWLDLSYAGKEQYYGRRFDSIGNPIGNPYMIPMSSPGDLQQRPDGLFLFQDRVYATWTNYIQYNNNTDIYCNVRGFQNPDTVIGIYPVQNIESGFILYAPYPNPFNAETNIRFHIDVYGFVALKIYNVLGKKIETLVNDYKQKGIYNIKWNAVNYPSGIYFIEIKTTNNFTEYRKLVLIK